MNIVKPMSVIKMTQQLINLEIPLGTYLCKWFEPEQKYIPPIHQNTLMAIIQLQRLYCTDKGVWFGEDTKHLFEGESFVEIEFHILHFHCIIVLYN